MVGHDAPLVDASEFQPVVNQILTMFQPDFQHIGENPAVTLGDLEVELSAPPVMLIQNVGDSRFMQLMSELEVQLMSEAATNELFDLDLPELLPALHGRPASMEAPPQPIQAAASACNNGAGVGKTRIDTRSSSAIPRRRTRSRIHRRLAAVQPSPLTAGGKRSCGGSGVRALCRASSSSSSTGSSHPRAR